MIGIILVWLVLLYFLPWVAISIALFWAIIVGATFIKELVKHVLSSLNS